MIGRISSASTIAPPLSSPHQMALSRMLPSGSTSGAGARAAGSWGSASVARTTAPLELDRQLTGQRLHAAG